MLDLRSFRVPVSALGQADGSLAPPGRGGNALLHPAFFHTTLKS